jgi:transposase
LTWLWRSASRRTASTPTARSASASVEFKKYATKQRRQSWTCTACGHHVHPTAGTIFDKSSTSLHLWFYAMYLMSSTRTGLSAKQLERELGVSYKTAWRMLNLIRTELMEQDDEPLSGEVEVDETALGRTPRLGEVEKFRREGETDLSGAGGRWKAANKSTVFAMVERGGRVRADVLPSRQAATLQPTVVKYVLPESTIFTDEWPSYAVLSAFAAHYRIRHTEKVYVSGERPHADHRRVLLEPQARHRGAPTTPSPSKWLQSYLNEYVWRYNHATTLREQADHSAEPAALRRRSQGPYGQAQGLDQAAPALQRPGRRQPALDRWVLRQPGQAPRSRARLSRRRAVARLPIRRRTKGTAGSLGGSP